MGKHSCVGNKIAADVQLKLFETVIRLVRRGARWFLRNRHNVLDIEAVIAEFKPKVKQIEHALKKFRKDGEEAYFSEKYEELRQAKVPELLATKLGYALFVSGFKFSRRYGQHEG